MLSETYEKTMSIAGDVKNKVSENEYGKKIIDLGGMTVDVVKSATYTIVEKGSEAVSGAKDIVYEKGNQLKDVVVTKSSEVKDVVVNKGSEYKDILINKSSEVKDMVVSKGSEVAVHILLK